MRKSGSSDRLSAVSFGAVGSVEERRASLGATEPMRLETPSSDRVLKSVLHLNREVRMDMSEDEIVRAYAEVFRNLFPHRRFAVCFMVSNLGRPVWLYVTGRARRQDEDTIRITREAMIRHGLLPDSHLHVHIDVTDSLQLCFEDTGHGFDVPLLDGNRVMGVLVAEYPNEWDEPEEDRAIVVQLALHMSSALCNMRLFRESFYLRDYSSKLIEHANAPIMVLGRNRDVLVVNRAFLALTEKAREDVLGVDFMDLLSEGERPRALVAFLNTLRGDPTPEFEVRIPRNAGGIARLALNTTLVRGADDGAEAIIAIGRDVTRLRELEEQVIHAEKLATIGQLATGVVHELNNPLTSISVYSEYLMKKAEQTKADPSDLEKLRRIEQSAARILRFVRDLMMYARPSSERPRLVPIQDVLDQSLGFCEHVLSECGARVEKQYCEQSVHVFGIHDQLQQVFINLFTNAAHAMPEGAGVLTVECNPPERGMVSVRVVDNGRGIPPDHMKRVFEPFFSTKGEGKGTGLGLSIVQNIIHQHRGEIDIVSNVGVGTTFTVYLRGEPYSSM